MTTKKKVYLASFIAPIAIMFVAWAIDGFFPFGTKSLMAVDFNAQYIGLYAYFKHLFLNGDWSSFFYSFSKSIGGGMLGIWGFNLLSPFNLLFLLTSEENFQWVVPIVIALRYGAMGLTMAHFLIKRYDGLKNKAYLVPIVATIYALNGFNVSYQMNPIFYDGMVMLPLVLIGVEQVLDNKSPKGYIGMLALSLFVQFYMGYMTCIFVVIYALFYIIRSENLRNKKVILTRIGKLAAASILAVGIVSAVLLPILISLVSTKGGLQSTLRFDWKLQINPFEILAKLFLGAFDNTSWPAGPNLPNIYVASFGLLGTLYYFISSKISKWSKIAASFVLVVFLISCAHEFTSKLWHMGQNPAGFFYRFSWIIAFFLVYLAYLSLREVEKFTKREASFLLISGAVIFSIVQLQQHSFLTVWQRLATILIFVVLLAALFYPKVKRAWMIIAALTVVELTANAALVQSRVGYTDAYKYHDAVLQLKEAINPIRPDHSDFYRINKSFNLSKNDPFMVDYPGLSVFSSNLENSTRDLFDRLGNNGINATTYYQGTPFQDALFSVKYLVTPKPVLKEDYPDTSKLYVFGNMVTRKDVTTKAPVYEAARTKTFETGLILPIAYGVNDATVNVKLENHQPIQNQNKIVQAMGATSENYLAVLGANEMKLDNMEVVDPSKPETYKRIDSSKPGTITYHLVPQSAEDYWVAIPQKLSHTDKNKVRVMLNGKNYEFQDKFQQTQFIQIAHNSVGQPTDLTIEIDSDNEYNLSGLRLARSNAALANRIIQERQLQGIKLTYWDNRSFKGTVNITDDSTWMMTSIPYEKGWTVKVDGKVVETAKVWDSLLAYKITPGEHTIEMSYLPDGFVVGFLISILSTSLYGFAIYKKWI
ncbi:ABC transporter permease [Streptococcus infantis]|uniref:ABC transporter permease n=1 Tax=Streptococcus infantis TaxID=68892 RepID=A0A0F2E3Q9_9STRE|nr:YfhO family protein [Streptococcus infantis]KJQ77852.1 ABC transporter permease [Streptococcus infantis]